MCVRSVVRRAAGVARVATSARGACLGVRERLVLDLVPRNTFSLSSVQSLGFPADASRRGCGKETVDRLNVGANGHRESTGSGSNGEKSADVVGPSLRSRGGLA